MNTPINPIATMNVPMAGQRLPANWQQQAAQRAKSAEEAYRQRIENSWRRGFDGPALSAAQAARLGQTAGNQELIEQSRLTSHQSPAWSELFGQQ